MNKFRLINSLWLIKFLERVYSMESLSNRLNRFINVYHMSTVNIKKEVRNKNYLPKTKKIFPKIIFRINRNLLKITNLKRGNIV